MVILALILCYVKALPEAFKLIGIYAKRRRNHSALSGAEHSAGKWIL